MFVIAALGVTKDPTAMKDKATGSLDRRDFVIASLATVGASAAFGEIAVRRTDATAEPGTLRLAILYNRASPESVSLVRSTYGSDRGSGAATPRIQRALAQTGRSC